MSESEAQYGLRPLQQPIVQPFVIKCISEQCTVVHAGVKRFTASALDDEINSNSAFGKKLKQARDEVAAL